MVTTHAYLTCGNSPDTDGAITLTTKIQMGTICSQILSYSPPTCTAPVKTDKNR
ncbi:hypothetical protein [Dulcicalothrix desertica]|uniref:hypothetical protein n=1 Tax=Dulcicalothrix desertica TaxID=32056 RepID=UPI0013154C11|nr:hypothetical protein [Dulcicalothrix desertica]